MEEQKRSPKRNRHTGSKVTAGAVLLALLLAGGHFGLGIGGEGGGLLTGDSLENAQEAVQNAQQTVTETAEKAQETLSEALAPQDDGVLTITVREDKLLYEGEDVTLTQLEENLLKDYKADATTVELKDDHAIKAAYDEVDALLRKLNIPFTPGK